MTISNARVIWSEGLFLQPQHFQQPDVHPADVELVPGARKLRGRRMRMVVVVELLTADQHAETEGQRARAHLQGTAPEHHAPHAPKAPRVELETARSGA